MFRKNSKSLQLNIFSSTNSLLSGKSLSIYEDESAWHNIFRQQVTMRIDEEIFRPLYCTNNGAPNAPVRILVAMMILKEAEGISDEKLFENCRFNMLIRSATGLMNADDQVPSDSTYYLFRRKIYDYAKETGINLFEKVFSQITKAQCVDFDVSGKSCRMDSKLLGSNIAWLSRYELVHESLRIFYQQARESSRLTASLKTRLDELLKIKGNKIVYRSTSCELKSKMQKTGILVNEVLLLFHDSSSEQYRILKQVFNEQYILSEDKVVIAKEKEEISAKSIQSPHDEDCDFRNKDGNKKKGYSVNVTESCDDDRLNLITNVSVKKVSTSDVNFLPEGIEKSQDVLPDKIEKVHADGAYHSPANQELCEKERISLHLHAIQGAKGRYEFHFSNSGDFSIWDSVTEEYVDYKKIITKSETVKWRIKTEKGYRYFTQNNIDNYLLRKQIEDTPVEILQKRNNVEATVFQLCYHYPNAKSRYRKLIKHQMWANIRCLWINFIRIVNHMGKIAIKNSFQAIFSLKLKISQQYFIVRSILMMNLNQSLQIL